MFEALPKLQQAFVEFGKQLADAAKEIVKFADEHLYPLLAEEAAADFEMDEWMRRETGLRTDLLGGG